MLNTLFQGLFDTQLTTVIPVTDFLLCLGASLALGLIMALTYMYRARYTKSFRSDAGAPACGRLRGHHDGQR